MVNMLTFWQSVSGAQLTNAGNLPQILTPAFKSSAPLHAGKRDEVIVSLTELKHYRIDRLADSWRSDVSQAR